ncbi:MAG: putative anti-sigma regulatory factor [Acidimicrobiaceae bacterium]|jgi:hypothetical protein|nr:putative anti-sigma regulatory factor [Acidimicrobiaceae bacterium]
MTAPLPSTPPEGISHLLRVNWEARDRVELALPTEAELWALARVTASTVAARHDFDYEAIEDLRLAIDELCTSCAAGAGPLSRLRLCFESDDETLRVECVVDHIDETADSDGTDDLPEGTTAGLLSEMILAELVDAHEIGPVRSGVRRGYLEKRRTATGS